MLSVPSVLIYNTREAPCSSLGRPKWPELAEGTLGASGCWGLAHPLVTWSMLAPGVFPAWSTAWFTISRKEDREHRANTGCS